MILDYLKSSKYLAHIFDKTVLTDWEKSCLLDYVKWMNLSFYDFESNNIDIYQLIPFFKTIEIDIGKFGSLPSSYGFNRQNLYWPYNKEIEDKLVKLGLTSKLNRKVRFYNELTEAVYVSAYDPNYMQSQMYNFGYYNIGFYDECSIRLHHLVDHNCCQADGGISLIIDRNHEHNIYIFGIGEDDGWFFPETYHYVDYKNTGINNYEFYHLTAMVNDIHLDNFDNQDVINKLYDEHEKYQIRTRK